MKPIFAVVAAALIAACASQGPRRADMPLLSEAESRIAANDFSGASHIYRQLVEESDSPDYYRLLAADAELRGGDSRAADTLLGAVNADELATPDWYRYVLLRSRMDLNKGRARDAMARLDSLNYQRLDPELAKHYHTLRASAFNQMGNMLESARERVYLGELLTNSKAVKANNEGIYDALNRLPDRALADLQPPAPDVLGGWMALAQIMRGPKPQRETAIRTWRSQYLNHPADGSFLEGLLSPPSASAKTNATAKPVPVVAEAARAEPLESPSSESEQAASQPAGAFNGGTVGVLLPLSGSFGPAGQAVKAGIEAARGVDLSPEKPALEFADTNGADIVALYRRLADRGATYVIGPLIKEDIAMIAKSTEITVPVLALNQNLEVNNDRIFQFGLTPEQEVEQSAGSAWFDGKHTAVVLAPASAFGQRMINHFSTYWRKLGGVVLAVKTYTAGGDDFSMPTKSLLAAAAAGGNSADFVFLIADTRDGSLLKPYLEAQQNYRSIPIYATSHIFNGRIDVPQNPDLSGVVFCDIPWFLSSSDEGSLSGSALRSTVDQTPENYRRLIAMGLDAYRLLPKLSMLSESSENRFDGSTGVLTVDDGHRIQRQLQCAQFSGGGIQTRGIAPMLKASGAGQASGASEQ